MALPTVVVKTGPEAGRRVDLTADLAIGRKEGDLVLEDPEVSRRHAVLRRSGESVLVEDLDSTNGTFVNGERIRSAIAVRPGDEVRVGQTTLEIERDWRSDDTIVAKALSPDQTRSSEAPTPDDHVVEERDATQPLPNRFREPGSRPAPSRRRWPWVGAVALAALVGVIGYMALVDRSTEDDFATRANDACAALQRSKGVDLSRTPTRGDLQGARNIRLKALGAMRALESLEQHTSSAGRFISAFGETNASIAGLERALGAGDHQVARALLSLREGVRAERDLAVRAGLDGCGALAFR